ncbi:McbB family protein [Pseudomonas sp. Teo4]|uniref:McbB family protein n=1 Tax=Pseudomonas sp. Teo4 TaxID=3064528 RepID=UPI002ABAE8FB|nr:McbB family protein [Pseudomonas sp. Teo4]MDZ3993785.1 hypothetical protein [Pseudomonas sp. Teo4]
MKALRVCNYEVLNFETDHLVYSASGITKIKNNSLTNALKQLIKLKKTEVAYKKIQDILHSQGLCSESTVKFLREISVLGDPPSSTYFEKAVIYCDWEIPLSEAKALKQRSNYKLEIKPLTIPTHIKSATPILFILASLSFDLQKVREIYDQLADNYPSSGISVGFVSGAHFHLTEPYIPTLKNPCAFCTIDRVIHYESLRSSHHHWSRLLGFCNTNRLPMPKAEIDELQHALIIGAISRSIKKLTTHQPIKMTQDKTLHSTTINLDTGNITEDVSVHWPLCRCLERRA